MTRLTAVLLALSLTAGTALTLAAPDAAPKAAAPKAAKADKAAAKPKVIKLGGDLDKLDLNDQQKADILKIRNDSKEAVAKLQAEIKKLNDEAKTKETAVLTPEQQTKLKSLEEEAKKARDAKAAEAKAAKAAATKPATK